MKLKRALSYWFFTKGEERVLGRLVEVYSKKNQFVKLDSHNRLKLYFGVVISLSIILEWFLGRRIKQIRLLLERSLTFIKLNK